MKKKILAASVAAALACAGPALAGGPLGGAVGATTGVGANVGANVGNTDVKAGINAGAGANAVTEGRPSAGNATEADVRGGAQGQVQQQSSAPQKHKRMLPRQARTKAGAEAEAKTQN